MSGTEQAELKRLWDELERLYRRWDERVTYLATHPDDPEYAVLDERTNRTGRRLRLAWEVLLPRVGGAARWDEFVGLLVGTSGGE